MVRRLANERFFASDQVRRVLPLSPVFVVHLGWSCPTKWHRLRCASVAHPAMPCADAKQQCKQHAAKWRILSRTNCPLWPIEWHFEHSSGTTNDKWVSAGQTVDAKRLQTTIHWILTRSALDNSRWSKRNRLNMGILMLPNRCLQKMEFRKIQFNQLQIQWRAWDTNRVLMQISDEFGKIAPNEWVLVELTIRCISLACALARSWL